MLKLTMMHQGKGLPDSPCVVSAFHLTHDLKARFSGAVDARTPPSCGNDFGRRQNTFRPDKINPRQTQIPPTVRGLICTR